MENKSGSRNLALKSKGGEALPLGFGSKDKITNKISIMEESTNKNKRGGARQGAGRKKIEGRVHSVTFRLSERAKQNLAAYAGKLGVSRQEAVNRILEGLDKLARE